MRKGLNALVLFLCLTGQGWAQTFWIPGTFDVGSLQLETYAATVPITITPATISKRISVLVHLASLSSGDWDLVQTRIRNLVAANRQNGGVNVYVLADTGLLSWLQVRNVSQYQADFRKLVIPATAISTESAWSEIVESIPEATEPFEALIVFSGAGDIENVALKSYIEAYASLRARAKSVRVFHWPTPSVPETSNWKTLISTTCGTSVATDIDVKELPTLMAAPCVVASYSMPTVSLGVYPFTGRVVNTETRNAVASVPLLNVANGWQPIRIDAYQTMLKLFDEAQAALAANDAMGVLTALRSVFQANPMYPPALRFGIDLYKRQKEWETASNLLSPLSDVNPSDPAIWAEMGEAHFNLRRWDRSEAAYLRSIELKADQPALLEQLGIIRESQADPDGAQRYFARVLALAPARVDLQTKRGDILVRLKRNAEAVLAFEESLKLQPSQDDIRIRVIGLYASLNTPDDVRRHLVLRSADVPEDVGLRMRYAELALAANLYEQALAYFTLALDIDRGHEPAYFGRAGTLLKLNKRAESFTAVDDGLKAAPSVRMHLMKFDLLDTEGRLVDSRAAIEDAITFDAKNMEILKRHSRIMDVFGNNAADSYSRLAEALSASKAPDELRRAALGRGLAVAIRDGNSQLETTLRPAVVAAGDTAAIKTVRAAPEATTILPGGVRALALVSQIRPDITAERFAFEYCQALIRNIQGRNKQNQETMLRSLRIYFETLEKLKRRMTPSPTGLDATLETTRQGYDKTEELLKLLGWRMERQRSRIVLDVGTDSEEAERQVFTGGFGIDFLAMKQALEAGKSFPIHIPYESVSIAIDETFWFQNVMDTSKPAGGLFERFIDHVPAQRLYVALAAVSPETRQQLLKNISAEKLAKRYSALLTFYGSSLSVNNGEIDLPGGKAATGAWEKLGGTSLSRPGPFLNTLLEKDDGKLLSYFHTMFNLPAPNQRFFTRTPQRLSAFYKAFPFAEKDILENQLLVRRNTAFFDLLRELPLDEDGSILFPGSEQVWMVAKGATENPDQIGKMLRRVRRAVAPEIEDKILLEILDTTFEIDGVEHNQSENFLAVVRLNRHRSEPMDEMTALVLTQTYNKYRALFPYLASMSALNSDHLVKFFKTARRIEEVDSKRLHQVLAQFHGVLSLIGMLAETRALQDNVSVSILMSFCDAFATARESRDFARGTLDAIQRMVAALPGNSSDTADTRLLNALAGVSSQNSFRSGQRTFDVDRADWQKTRISGVLTAQSATPLQVLLNAYAGVQNLIAGKGDPQQAIRILEQESAKLLEISPRPEDQLTDNAREFLIQGDPKEIAEIVARLKKESTKKDLKPLVRIANDYLDQLNPYLKTTLTGWVYARYSSPDDLVIAEDRYFTRRHFYYGRLSGNIWIPTEVRFANGTSGMYLQGGLAQIAYAAGQWGQSRAEADNSIRPDPAFEFTSRTQLAAIRSVPWMNVSNDALHLAALQLRIGREILVEAARDTALRQEVIEKMMGFVGNFRRRAIQTALTDNDAGSAIDLLSASDLYFMVEGLKPTLRNWKTRSPLIDEFRKHQDNAAWSQVAYLGGVHLNTYGCVHAHLVHLGPYEEYERIIIREPMAERLSDVLLNAAEIANREGVPSDALAILSESLLRELATSTTMTESNDWLAAIRAMNRMSIAKALPDLERLRK